MSSGKIRKGETNRFPIESEICWYFVLTIEDCRIEDEYFTGAKGDKKLLLNRLIELQNERIYARVYGVCPGKYNTDLFDLDLALLIERIKQYFGEK